MHLTHLGHWITLGIRHQHVSSSYEALVYLVWTTLALLLREIVESILIVKIDDVDRSRRVVAIDNLSRPDADHGGHLCW